MGVTDIGYESIIGLFFLGAGVLLLLKMRRIQGSEYILAGLYPVKLNRRLMAGFWGLVYIAISIGFFWLRMETNKFFQDWERREALRVLCGSARKINNWSFPDNQIL